MSSPPCRLLQETGLLCLVHSVDHTQRRVTERAQSCSDCRSLLVLGFVGQRGEVLTYFDGAFQWVRPLRYHGEGITSSEAGNETDPAHTEQTV